MSRRNRSNYSRVYTPEPTTPISTTEYTPRHEWVSAVADTGYVTPSYKLSDDEESAAALSSGPELSIVPGGMFSDGQLLNTLVEFSREKSFPELKKKVLENIMVHGPIIEGEHPETILQSLEAQYDPTESFIDPEEDATYINQLFEYWGNARSKLEQVYDLDENDQRGLWSQFTDLVSVVGTLGEDPDYLWSVTDVLSRADTKDARNALNMLEHIQEKTEEYQDRYNTLGERVFNKTMNKLTSAINVLTDVVRRPKETKGVEYVHGIQSRPLLPKGFVPLSESQEQEWLLQQEREERERNARAEEFESALAALEEGEHEEISEAAVEVSGRKRARDNLKQEISELETSPETHLPRKKLKLTRRKSIGGKNHKKNNKTTNKKNNKKLIKKNKSHKPHKTHKTHKNIKKSTNNKKTHIKNKTQKHKNRK